MVDANLGLIIMKCFDNMSVHVTANHGTAEISKKVRRWNGEAKKRVLVDCPDIVKNTLLQWVE